MNQLNVGDQLGIEADKRRTRAVVRSVMIGMLFLALCVTVTYVVTAFYTLGLQQEYVDLLVHSPLTRPLGTGG